MRGAFFDLYARYWLYWEEICFCIYCSVSFLYTSIFCGQKYCPEQQWLMFFSIIFGAWRVAKIKIGTFLPTILAAWCANSARTSLSSQLEHQTGPQQKSMTYWVGICTLPMFLFLFAFNLKLNKYTSFHLASSFILILLMHSVHFTINCWKFQCTQSSPHFVVILIDQRSKLSQSSFELNSLWDNQHHHLFAKMAPLSPVGQPNFFFIQFKI